MAFSIEQSKAVLKMSYEYFKNTFPNGVTLQEIQKLEEDALKRYLKFFTNNVQRDNMQRSSACKKARKEWFMLETVEKVLKMNNLESAQNFDFLLSDQNQVKLFNDYVKNEEYNSYLVNDDLEK